jgi:TPR repeat protein
MKSCIAFIITLATCFSPVFAETTVELIQQRAEAGDATAQTLMGLMSFYGYQVPRDTTAAKDWYQRAADQGDSFADIRLQSDSRIKSDIRTMSPDEFEKKVTQASSVPYEGDVTFDELATNRNKYVGKVIELSFTILPAVGMPVEGIQYIYVRDPKAYGTQGGSSDKLYMYGDRALKWRQEIGKKSSGTSSTVYALVEKDGLIALGIRQREIESGREYKW